MWSVAAMLVPAMLAACAPGEPGPAGSCRERARAMQAVFAGFPDAMPMHAPELRGARDSRLPILADGETVPVLFALAVDSPVERLRQAVSELSPGAPKELFQLRALPLNLERMPRPDVPMYESGLEVEPLAKLLVQHGGRPIFIHAPPRHEP